jgi:hypothetical protein
VGLKGLQQVHQLRVVADLEEPLLRIPAIQGQAQLVDYMAAAAEMDTFYGILVRLTQEMEVLAAVALSVLSGQDLLVSREHSHQQIQGICNGTLYSD